MGFFLIDGYQTQISYFFGSDKTEPGNRYHNDPD